MKSLYAFLLLFLSCSLLHAQVINDEPCGALPVQCGQQINSTTAFAQPDTLPFCGTGNGTGGGVWYSITPVEDTQITLSLCGTDAFDSRIRVFGGSCDTLSCITGEDDDFGNCLSDDPEVSFVPTTGATYYILVHGFANASGIFTLSISCANDCPLLGNIGDPCDDGNPTTENDVVLPNCSCQGVAPPANDEPCNATVLTCGTTLFNQTIVGATFSEGDECGGSGIGDVWYTFSADGTQNNTFSIVDPNFEFDGVLELYQSDFCSALFLWEECTDGPETYTVSVQGTYFIKVRPYSETENSVFGVQLTCSELDCPGIGNFGDPCNDGDVNTTDDVLMEDCTCFGEANPFNDKPCNAQPLDCGDNLEDVSIFGGLPPLDCLNNSSLWYVINVGAEKGVVLEFQSCRISVFTGDTCETLLASDISCFDGTFIEFSEEGTYFIEVADDATSSGSTSPFDLSVTCYARPENDNPCGAVGIECGNMIEGDFFGSTATGIDLCNSQPQDVWYRLEVDNDTTVYNVFMDSFGSVEVFVPVDSCDSLEVYQFECNSVLQEIRLAGQNTYLIRLVANPSTFISSIQYSLEIECAPRAPNDKACDALPLFCGIPKAEQNMANASSNSMATCNPFDAFDPDLWYTFSADEGERIEMVLNGQTSSLDLAIWTGTDCTDLQPLDVCDANFSSLTPGDYYLQVLGALSQESLFSLRADCLLNDPNNTCSQAKELSCGDLIASDLPYTRSSSAQLSCETFFDNEEDAWYYFEGEAGIAYEVELLNGENVNNESFEWDGLFAIYRGDDCTSGLTQAFELICVNEETGFFSGNESALFTATESGRYYIRVLLDQGATSHRVGLDCSAIEIPDCTDPYPAVPFLSLSSTVNSNSVDLSWEPILGSIGCQVEGRPLGSSGSSTLTQGGANVSGLTVPGGALQAGTTYEWRVRCGCSQSPLIVGEWSDFAQFTFTGSMIQTSPNPTDGISNVSFELATDGNALLELVDLSGRLIRQIHNGFVASGREMRFQYDGGHLPNGIYLYRLTTRDDVITEKMMIAK